MSLKHLTFGEWSRYSDAEKRRCAERLATELPQAVQATGVQTFRLAERQETLAVFDYRGSAFVLIPGTTVNIGYDAGRFRPTDEQLETFRASAGEYEIGDSIQDFVQGVSTPPRTVTTTPALVEMAPQEIGLESILPESPEVRNALKKVDELQSLLKKPRSAARVVHFNNLRVQREEDGSMQAWRIVKKTHPELVKELRAAGLRLPTSDEWEYLCGAGAQTLFRWGDFCPCDRYPVGNRSNWDLHLRPNAFGLFIARNPYDCEVVAEPGIVRGGDGGCNVCGGVGFFLGWLPLATAYQDKAATGWLEEDISKLFFRRIIPIE
jgi:hypothetical protein